MSKALKVIGTIAGAIALVATGVGSFAVAGSALATTASSIATYAGIASSVAMLGSNLTAKPPTARGSVTSVLIAANAPAPYVMGEGYNAGVLRYQRSYGATLNKVPNPYRFCVLVHSVGGPVHSLTPYADQAAIGSWYSGFLYTDTQLGACPESDALAPHWSGAPGWGGASKLSGKAATGFSLKFDKDGKRFASGMPQLGAYGKWVKVYDPRLDSTRAGGSGSQRVNNESTWTWSENPALHAATYAIGRHQNGKRVFGIGLPADGIDWANVAAWANVCDSNGWTLFGVIYEPGDRFANLRDICIAGGAEPILAADALRFHYAAPRVALDTVTIADLVAGEEQHVTAMASWRDRLNTVLPTYRSADHNWELVQAAPVQVSTWVTQDREVKQADWPFNLVKQPDQAAALARYRLEDSRELQPIVLVCTPRLRAYRPGDCLTLDLLDELGLATDAVIVSRKFDPAKMTVTLELIGETPAKHAYALGETATPPPTPALGQTPQQRDEAASGSSAPPRSAHMIVAQDATFPVTSDDTHITIAAFNATIDDGRSIAFPSATIGSLSSGVTYAVLWNLETSAYETPVAPATTELANDKYVFLQGQTTSSGGTFTPPADPPPGWGGGGGFGNDLP